MKHIMISIKPEWTEKILRGEKILEIRKSMPQDLPCKVYIYCTKDSKHLVAPFNFVEGWFYKVYDDNTHYCNGCSWNMGETINGKVVAEFTLKVVEILKSVRYRKNGAHYQYNEVNDNILQKSCLSEEQILDYTNGQDLYAWHIEDLHIYDKPKELAEFGLKRPPQSWCYIKGENNESVCD